MGDGERAREREKAKTGELGVWEGGDGERVYIGAGKKISALREPF